MSEVVWLDYDTVVARTPCGWVLVESDSVTAGGSLEELLAKRYGEEVRRAWIEDGCLVVEWGDGNVTRRCP